MQELVEGRTMSELKLVLFRLTFDTESGNIENVDHSKAVRRYKVRNDAWSGEQMKRRVEWEINDDVRL